MILDKIEFTDYCWLWTGYTTKEGYGLSGGKCIHRIMYERYIGPIPEGLELDHICKVRNCVRPDHVEPVTHLENIRRGEHNGGNRSPTCVSGHIYDKINASGNRFCSICYRNYQREYRREYRRTYG